jgi:putative transposase
MRNLLARVPKGNAEMVAAAIRTVFAQPDAEHVHSQLDVSLACSAASFRRWRRCSGRRPMTWLAFTGFP